MIVLGSINELRQVYTTLSKRMEIHMYELKTLPNVESKEAFESAQPSVINTSQNPKRHVIMQMYKIINVTMTP